MFFTVFYVFFRELRLINEGLARGPPSKNVSFLGKKGETLDGVLAKMVKTVKNGSFCGNMQMLYCAQCVHNVML